MVICLLGGKKMRKGFFAHILVILLLLEGSAAFADGWHITKILDDGSWWDIVTTPIELTLQMDTTGYPQFVFRPEIGYMETPVKYVYWNGEDYSIDMFGYPTYDGFPPSNEVSFALDSMDNAHIVYSYHYRQLMSPYLFFTDFIYKKKTGSSWGWDTLEENYGDAPTYCGEGSSLALDSQNRPHISYLNGVDDTGNPGYVTWTGSSWSYQTIDTNALDTCIAVDSQDYPHILYSHPLVKYASWNGSKWDIQTVDNIEFGPMVLDSLDNPHIAYNSGFDIMYSYWTGSAWIVESIGDTGRAVSLALDSEDNPHISYMQHEDLGDIDAEHMKIACKNDSGNWDILDIFTFLDPAYYPYTFTAAANTCILIDSQDKPCLALMTENEDTTSIAHLYYGWYGPNNPPDSFNLLSPPDGETVDFDMYDNVYLDWEDSADQDADVIAYDLWISENSDFNPHSEHNFLPNSRCTLSDGLCYGHIYYWKVKARDQSGETWCNQGYWSFIMGYTETELLSFSAQKNADGDVVLKWQTDKGKDANISGFNMYRHEIKATTEAKNDSTSKDYSDWRIVNSALITGTNPYSYIDTGVEPEKDYEYRLEAVLVDGKETLGTAQTGDYIPTTFSISKVYPNPADTQVTLQLQLPQSGDVEIMVYDLSGRLVEQENTGELSAGISQVVFSTEELNNGVYTVVAKGVAGESNVRMVVAR